MNIIMKELNLEQMSQLEGGCEADTWMGFWVGATAGSLLLGPGAFVVMAGVSLIGSTVTQAFCDGPYS